jgi:hypothetical protein
MSVPQEQLVEWKAKLLRHGHGWDGYAVDVVGVIDELLTLRAENERLREAAVALVDSVSNVEGRPTVSVVALAGLSAALAKEER